MKGGEGKGGEVRGGEVKGGVVWKGKRNKERGSMEIDERGKEGLRNEGKCGVERQVEGSVSWGREGQEKLIRKNFDK